MANEPTKSKRGVVEVADWEALVATTGRYDDETMLCLAYSLDHHVRRALDHIASDGDGKRTASADLCAIFAFALNCSTAIRESVNRSRGHD